MLATVFINGDTALAETGTDQTEECVRQMVVMVLPDGKTSVPVPDNSMFSKKSHDLSKCFPQNWDRLKEIRGISVVNEEGLEDKIITATAGAEEVETLEGFRVYCKRTESACDQRIFVSDSDAYPWRIFAACEETSDGPETGRVVPARCQIEQSFSEKLVIQYMSFKNIPLSTMKVTSNNIYEVIHSLIPEQIENLLKKGERGIIMPKEQYNFVDMIRKSKFGQQAAEAAKKDQK